MDQILQLYQDLHSHILDIDRIPTLITAIIVCMVAGMITGPVAGNAAPLFWQFWDILLGGVGSRLNKLHRGRADLLFRGFLLTSFAVLMAVLLGKAATAILPYYNYYAILETLFLCVCLTSGAIWFVMLRLYTALEREQNLGQGGYFAIARTTRVDLNSTDSFGITRTAMALSARAFDKGLVAPALWYLIGGIPFMFAYTCLAALAWRFGQNGFTKGFGAVPLALEKLFGYIPSVLAALLLSTASTFTPTAGIFKSIRSWFSRKQAAPYEQGGFPVTVMAWALNISLGGPVQDLRGATQKNKWVGPKNATAQIGHKHLRRGLYINMMAHILLIAALLGAYIWGHSLPVVAP